jgi:hypothetical protein
MAEVLATIEQEDKKEKVVKLVCPRCKSTLMRRNFRHGFLEEKVWPKFGYYPWECCACREVSYFRTRYHPSRSEVE